MVTISTSGMTWHAWKTYDEVAADAEEQLSRSPEPEAARDELQLILTDARRLGFGYEGR